MKKALVCLGVILLLLVSAGIYSSLPGETGEVESALEPGARQALESPTERRGNSPRTDTREALAPPSAPERSTAQPVLIRCLSPDRIPLEGAKILVFLDDAWAVQGTTDADGEYTWSRPENSDTGGELKIGATHGGYAAAEGTAEPDASSVELVLEHGGVIEGVLLGFHWKGPKRPSIVVFPKADERLGIHMSELLAGNPRYMHLRPDDAGTFRVEGLVIDQPYQFQAVGAGGMSAKSPIATAGTMDRPGRVEVTWAQVFVAKLIFTGPQGAPLQLVDNAIGYTSKGYSAPSYQPRAGLGHWSPSASLGRDLLSIRSDTLTDYEKGLKVWTPAVVKYPTPGGRPPVLTDVGFTYQLAGYHLLESTFDFTPLNNKVKPQRFELVPWAESWGTLEITLTGLEYLKRQAPLGRESRTYFVDVDGGRVNWTRAFRGPLVSPLVLTGIPAGQYQVRLGTHQKTLQVNASGGPVLIGDGTTYANIDLSRTGSLELRLFDRGKQVFPPQINFFLTPESGKRAGTLESCYCPSPPFVTHHLPEGPYQISLYIPWDASVKNPNAIPVNTVLIHAGTTTVVELHKPE